MAETSLTDNLPSASRCTTSPKAESLNACDVGVSAVGAHIVNEVRNGFWVRF